MPTFGLPDDIPPRSPREELWREWCLLKAVVRQRWRSAALLVTLLLGGGLLFVVLEPHKNHGYIEGIYYTWCLIFGQPPENFPDSWVLRAMYFVVPALGLAVLLEAIIAVSRMIRDRQTYEQSWCRIMAESMSDHVILVGLGRLGYRTFRLLRQLGERVVVIEANPQNQFLEDVRHDGSPLLVGDARREVMLQAAGLARARSVIACTTDDLANLEIALDARRMRPDVRVVVRMFDQNMADKVRHGFNIRYAMSQAMISAPAFAMAAVRLPVVSSAVVGDQVVVTVRCTIGPAQPFAGLTVGQVLEKFAVGILEHRPAGAGEPRLFPPPGTPLAAGDTVLIQGPFQTLVRLGLEPDSSRTAPPP
jgi:Trk K+ transport system NAD-binding subunit